MREEQEQVAGERRTVFVMGGVKSGKSEFALETGRSLSGGAPALFIPTADSSAPDDDFRKRIERHAAERPVGWVTIEAPLDPAAPLESEPASRVAVVDCLTVWLSNLMARCGDAGDAGFREKVEKAVESATARLLGAIVARPGGTVLVANDVGSGVAPPTVVGNVFADMQGTLNRRVAAACNEVYLLMAGIPVRIK